jgi:hypothetical protein
MKETYKQQWVAALRSGQYSQTKGQLRTTEAIAKMVQQPVGFCCLGVLSDVVKDEIGGYWDSHGNFHDGDGGNNGYCLPLSVVKLTGLNDKQDTLATMNDGGSTFNEIADWIEDYIKSA